MTLNNLTTPDTPPITVIMPVYNAAKFLDESIPSILNQSFDNFEFIIIDDCSTDDSPLIIKQYADKDPRIVFIRNEVNINNIATRNKALEYAKGEYIAELDGDDIALPNRLERQYQYLRKYPEITLIGGGSEIIDNTGLIIGFKRPNEDFNLIKYKMLFGNPFVHSTIFYKKDIIKKLGSYNSEYNHAEDYYLYYTLLQNGYRLGNIPELIIKYRSHQQSITAIPETRKIQLVSSYNISYDYLNKYLPVSPNKIKIAVDTIHKRRVDLSSTLSTIFFCKKLTRSFIQKEGLDKIESEKIWKIYNTDNKKHLFGNYLKTNWPKLTKIIKNFYI